MDISRYLKRIGFTGKIKQDAATLRQLQHCHLFSVPFEDLDIFYGIPISLHTTAFYNKVVAQGRGGYCYELNGLFYELLKQLGFNVSMISGRFIHANGNITPEFDHMALTVELNDMKWLVDVGFGDFSLVPLQLVCGQAQHDGRNTYLITEYTTPDNEKCLSAGKWSEAKKTFVPQYIFSLQAHNLHDFAAMNQQQQTSPDSHFVKNLICSLPTASGRISIINNRLIETVGGAKKVMQIGEGGNREVLREWFGMEFSILDVYNIR